MAAIDIVVLVYLAIGILVGIWRGFSGELARLAGAAVALIAGLYLYGPAGRFLSEHTRLSGRAAEALSFFIVFIVALLVAATVAFVFRVTLRRLFGERKDRFWGGIAGALRSLCAVAALFVLMNLWPHEYLNDVFGEGSFVGRSVLLIMPSVHDVIDEMPECSCIKKIIEDD